MKPYKSLPLGTRFGSWTTISSGISGTIRIPVTYKVRCDCGNEGIVRRESLMNGLSLQCKPCHLIKLNTLKGLRGYASFPLGTRYGSWTTISDKISGTMRIPVKYKVRCDCGNEGIVGRATLMNGLSLQCKKCSLIKLHAFKNKYLA
jgi:hypothetical protein